MNTIRTRRLTYSALIFALGLILPAIIRMIPIANLTSYVSPMHIPVLLAGFVVGWKHAAAIGLLLPPVSFLVSGMPPIYPVGLSMMTELATYGLVAALLYNYTKGKVLISLLGAMLAGRIVFGIANAILLGLSGVPYGFGAFITSAFITAVPAIILHIIVVPAMVYALQRAKLTIATA